MLRMHVGKTDVSSKPYPVFMFLDQQVIQLHFSRYQLPVHMLMHLLNIGRIRATQLDYSEAHRHLLQVHNCVVRYAVQKML